MDVKEWLSRGRNLNTEIAVLTEARQKAFDLACMIGGSSGDVKVQTSRENKTENRLLSLAEYDRQLADRVNQLYRTLEEINRTAARVSDSILRLLLTERYINCKTWEQVADSMGYQDVRHVYRLHKRALVAVEKVLHKKFHKFSKNLLTMILQL